MQNFHYIAVLLDMVYGLELEDQDFVDYKNSLKHMKEHDDNLDEQLIEEEYKNRRVKHE